MIILGDFHQFPPVARPIREALYYPLNMELDSLQSQIGRAIYEEFSVVVILKEQKRVTDLVWLDFLRHLRSGNVQDHHLKMLRSLIIGKSGGMSTSFEDDEWNTVALVTPRHAVRKQWNAAMLYRTSRITHQRIFVCTAEDTHNGRVLDVKEECILENHRSKHNKGGSHTQSMKDLPYQIEIMLGMRVMVTDNIEVDLDIANGAIGEIVGIILHEEDSYREEDNVVILKHLPVYLLIKLSKTRTSKLPNLEERVVPIEPIKMTYRIRIPCEGNKVIQRTIQRRQFAITGAYSFTDYRSQGQTISYVLVDIGPPPSGTLSLFNRYVPLLRSSGHMTIRLLRDFDDEMLLAKHDTQLLMEDKRLEELNHKTKGWYNDNIKKG